MTKPAEKSSLGLAALEKGGGILKCFNPLYSEGKCKQQKGRYIERRG
jgi:hypothetical protein